MLVSDFQIVLFKYKMAHLNISKYFLSPLLFIYHNFCLNMLRTNCKDSF